MGKKTQKGNLSGTAHRTKGTKEGTIILDGIAQDGIVELHVNGAWVLLTDYVQENKILALLFGAEKEMNSELREANDSLNGALNRTKENLDCERGLAADWQRIAKHYEMENTNLQTQIEEMTAPTGSGMMIEPGTKIEYHYTDKEGHIMGPMARITEAVKELEEMKLYVKFDIEYDTPAGKHSK